MRRFHRAIEQGLIPSSDRLDKIPKMIGDFFSFRAWLFLLPQIGFELRISLDDHIASEP